MQSVFVKTCNRYLHHYISISNGYPELGILVPCGRQYCYDGSVYEYVRAVSSRKT